MTANRKNIFINAAIILPSLPPALCLLSILANGIVDGYNLPKNDLAEICCGSVEYYGDPGPYQWEGFWYSAPPVLRSSRSSVSSTRVEPVVCRILPSRHGNGCFKMLVTRPYPGWYPF
jgi:hypothetical protein